LAYVGTATVAVAVVVGALWGFLDADSRRGLGAAGAVAVVVQVAAFALLLGLRDRDNGLLLGMAGGTAGRLGALGVAGVVVSVGEPAMSASALILGLAGFLFALSLLEAVFLRGMNGSGQAE
jgi:hypothetical protein